MIREASIRKRLNNLYGNRAEYLTDEIVQRIRAFNQELSEKESYALDEKKSILITYADSILGKEMPLKVLKTFLNEKVKSSINTVHILPFFPYSSDDGFSVIDYKAVNPEFGDWQDVKELSEDYKIMFDAVINHISAKSDWFKGYLKGEEKYKDYFIEEYPDTDLSSVTRPRALPLLSEFDTNEGRKNLWTTFSADQIDLNYKSENLLLDVIDVLFFYAKNGASLIRLDAVGYMWKEVGTSCIHLPQTHDIIKLMRDIFDSLDKKVIIITETNVPHQDNISYFGNGTDEAQMVYNFSLPPLVLNAYQIHSSEHIEKWATTLSSPSDETTFFNFLASHDGVGLMPVKGILKDEEIEKLVEKVTSNGGKVSYKTNSDGSQSPYEMNINYYDALYDPSESKDKNIDKFLGAYFIAFSLSGIPGIYIHSLLGSRNWTEGVEKLGYNRAINREKLSFEELKRELSDTDSRRSQIFNGMLKMLSTRQSHSTFSPKAEQKILDMDSRIFGIRRKSKEEELLALINLSNESVEVELEENERYFDILNDEQKENQFTMKPYEYLWISVE